MKKLVLGVSLLFSSIFCINAQDGFENILLADVNDSQKLLQAYFAPGMEGFINSMNNGWAHTAKAHKVFGFDLSFGVSGSMIPSDRETFNIAALGLTSVSSSSSTAQTFGGKNVETQMTVNTTINGQNATASFNFPGGIKDELPLDAVPAPFVQFTLGLPGKIDAMLRLVPKTSFGEDEGSINLLGIGLKKEITSWFGPMDKTPLHVALMAAYTKMDVNYVISDSPDPDFTAQNATTSFDLSAFTVQAIASLNFPVINLYGGFGYNSGNASFNMAGNFTGTYDTGLPAPNDTITQTLNVPSNIDFDSSGFRTSFGARLSLGFFKIFADYTIHEFNSLTAGIAFSFR